MKIIITEQQSLFLKRRLEEIDEFVKLALRRVSPSGYNFHDYVEEITWQVLDEYDGKISREEMEEMHDFVQELYWKEIETYYLKSSDWD